MTALQGFDQEVIEQVDRGDLRLEDAIADCSIDDPLLHLIHVARFCNHLAQIWDRNLAAVALPEPVAAYAEFTATEHIRSAVHSIALDGDTFFMQFRAVHQVPELLSEQANDLDRAVYPGSSEA